MSLNLSFFTRDKKTPIILQSENAECGLACVAMIAAHFGYRRNFRELQQKFSLSSRGAALRRLIEISNALNMNARPLKTEVDGLLDLKLPCVLHWDMSHYVVLIAIKKGRYLIHDPAVGRRDISMNEVSESFTGVCLELTPRHDFQTDEDNSSPALAPLLGKVHGLAGGLSQLLVLGTLIQLLSLSAPYYMQWIVDEALVSDDYSLVLILALAFSVILIIQALLTGIRSWMTTTLSTEIKFHWFGNVFEHLLRLPLDYFSKRSLGDITSRFGSVHNIQQTISTSFIESLMDGMLVLVVLALMISYSLELTLIALISVAIYYAIRAVTRRTMEEAIRAQLVNSAMQQTKFLETIRGMQTIRLFGRGAERWAEWTNLVGDQFNKELKIARFNLGYNSANMLLFGIERILLISLSAHHVLEGKFTVGMMIAFLGYKEIFSSKVSSLVDVINEFKMLGVQRDRLDDIANTEAEPYSLATEEGRPISPHIRLDNISFKYGADDKEILTEICLDIPFGQAISITGPSGGGKTTLIKIITALLNPVAGSIFVNGSKMDEIGLQNYRSILGVVMQDDQLFAGTISDNIHFFDANFDQSQVEDAARLAGIHDEINRFPMGYRTIVGDLGTGLSGGQKQRIFLARALYRRPQILLLDEATSHLDVRSEAIVNESIAKLKITRIIIAHRPQTIASADRVIKIENGRISGDMILRESDRHQQVAELVSG